MPPLKHAAKKAPARHVAHDETKDMRRAYEHLGRVEALRTQLPKAQAKDVTTLVELAAEKLDAKHPKDAADLLRAAEHLSFGALPGKAAEAHPELLQAITEEFEQKLKKAAEHWTPEEEHHAEIERIYTQGIERARVVYDEGSYQQALELARGVEALAHVNMHF